MKLLVEFEYDDKDLGKNWFNIDNLGLCLFSKEHTKPELLKVREIKKGEKKMENEIVKKLRTVKTMPELDALRMETVKAMKEDGNKNFYSIQKEFTKARNRLERIPLRDRTW